MPKEAIHTHTHTHTPTHTHAHDTHRNIIKCFRLELIPSFSFAHCTPPSILKEQDNVS